MVAPVYTGGERWECHAEKWMSLDPFFQHLLEETAVDTKRSYVVVDHAYLDAGTGSFYQGILDPVSESIVLEYVILEMDIAVGFCYVAQKRFKFVCAVVEYLYLVSGDVVGITHGLPQLY